ncbi:hypothetical protein OPQ81_000384 [Rhizoctonia solani]|nr:hypothetical protein OPQ81_000384 [Rhizoctonia solani]
MENDKLLPFTDLEAISSSSDGELMDRGAGPSSHTTICTCQATINKPVATKRHSKFYFDNTLIVMQVEDTLFNVHKYQLLKSETFSDMFAMPKKTDRESEGTSPESPIVLEGVRASDFEALLTVLYARTLADFPSHFSSHQPTPEAHLIIPAFRLANMWNFSDLRDYLLPLAGKVFGDVDKIVFAREFDIQDWLAPAHKNLCERPEPLTTEEARKLGVDSLLLISRMREQYRPPKPADGPAMYFCTSCAGVSYMSGSYTCTACNTRTSPSYQHSASVHSSSTSTALATKITRWVANGCVFKE